MSNTFHKADLHNHVRTSSNFKKGDFDRVCRVAKARLGESGIVGIVNFSDRRFESLVHQEGLDRYASNEGKSLIRVPEYTTLLRGQEIPTKKGHVLVLGLSQNVHIKERMSLEDTIKAARENEGIIIADHPFGKDGVGEYLSEKPELLHEFDALETYNAEAGIVPYANSRAKNFFQGLNIMHNQLGALTSSDGHTFHEIGRNWTELSVEGELSIRSLREAIRDTDYSSYTRREQSLSAGIIGAGYHVASLIGIIGLSKMGLGKRFETTRPKGVVGDPNKGRFDITE